MALRLTGTPLPQTSSPAEPAGQFAEALAPQARALIARGDVEGYRSLFHRAADLEDPHRRYHARLALLQAGLAGTAGVSEATAVRVFLAAAEAALTVLEREPSEPLLLNLAGVALYELWSLDAAAALFAAAHRLDGQLRDAQRNLDEVGRRRRLAGRMRRPQPAAVTALARRGRAVAERAQPATGLTLSLCMIVRDEEQMLPRCLAAAAPAVDEIIVVDTGSTDATIEIARSFGARVIEFPWTGSFSEARNVSFEAATGDWLLYLDADEILVTEDSDTLRALTRRTWREAFYLVETSYLGELGAGNTMVNNALRVFRNRPGYRFTDRLHEQISHSLPTYAPGRIEQTPVRIQHYGYLGSVREAKEKSKRNLELLIKQAADTPPTPFLHFNLGSEYAAADDPRSAVQEFERARDLLVAEGSLQITNFAPPLMTRLITVLCQVGRPAEAAARAQEGLALWPDFTDLVFTQARIAEAIGDTEEAVALYEQCIASGDAPPLYHPMVGCGTFLPRMSLAAIALERGDIAQARGLLEWCVEHHADFLAVAAPYAQVLLRDGTGAADVVREIETRLGTLPPTVRLGVAHTLRRAGAAREAEDQYRRTVTDSPSNAAARTALGELLLARGAWDDAAQQARAVDERDPYGGLAVRIELIALAGRTDAETVRSLLERAGRAGVSRAEREVFDGWLSIADGGPAPEGLSVAGVPLLGVILETLLQAADGERFTALVPLLVKSRLPRREQRELLAGMYLSHGLVAAAAAEWLEVCAHQPDVRALLGLARVAVQQRMPADAVNFATGALELDPGSVEAREMLAAL